MKMYPTHEDFAHLSDFKVQIFTPNDPTAIETYAMPKNLRDYEGVLSHLIKGSFGDSWDAQIVFPPRREERVMGRKDQ